MKRNPADEAFSKCVREAANWTCERCLTQYQQGAQGLHCSHIYSRRHRTIRWAKDNVQALCCSCHQWFGGNPADSGVWIRSLLGEDFIQMLIEKRDQKTKVSKLEEKDIAKHYREQLKKLQQRRNQGETGVLEFDSWQ